MKYPIETEKAAPVIPNQYISGTAIVKDIRPPIKVVDIARFEFFLTKYAVPKNIEKRPNIEAVNKNGSASEESK
jgi:hypothetical protein